MGLGLLAFSSTTDISQPCLVDSARLTGLLVPIRFSYFVLIIVRLHPLASVGEADAVGSRFDTDCVQTASVDD